MPGLSPSHKSLFSVVLDRVSVTRGGSQVLHDVSLTIDQSTRAAVVGPNGVGKSTLLSVIAGDLIPSAGSVRRSPPTSRIGLLEQELDHSVAGSVRDALAVRHGIRSAEAALTQTSNDLALPAMSTDSHAAATERYDAALQRFLTSGAADFDARLEQTADELGLANRLLDADLLTLSGGEAERVGLLSTMLSRFDVILLDEPTNNLDLDGLRRLEGWLEGYPGAVLTVSHDRAFLKRIVTSVIEIDPHQQSVTVFNGGWQAYLRERDAAHALAQQQYREYSDKKNRLTDQVQTKREWVDKGVRRANKFPADGDKHRRNHQLDQTERLAGKSKALRQKLDRLEVVDKPREPWDLRFSIKEAERGGDLVASLDQAVFTRGEFTDAGFTDAGFKLGPLTLEIGWGDRVAIVGRNGSGKSTLLDGLLGRLKPSSGQVCSGHSLVIGELDQNRDGLGNAKRSPSLLSSFEQRSGLAGSEARSVLAKFGLGADVVSRPVSTLSPGERTRAQLAEFQARGVNVLVLDEPTNHLDVAAIEQLESALGSFTGTLLLVSHDRALLDNVTTTRTLDLDQM